MVERFNRSLQTKLYRIIMYNKSKGVRESLAIFLERVIKDHNALKHSTTGIAPKDITPVVSGKLLALQNQYRKHLNLGRKSGLIQDRRSCSHNQTKDAFPQSLQRYVFRRSVCSEGAPQKMV